MDVKSPFAGKIISVYAEAGAEVEVGKDLFEMERGAAPTKVAEKAPSAPTAAPAVVAAASTGSAPTPAAIPTAVKPAAKSEAPVVSQPTAGDRSETRVKMTRMRLRIAQRLKEAQGTAAMLTTFQECDMGNLIDMRNKYKDQFEKVHGVKLGFMSAFVKVRKILALLLPRVDYYIILHGC